MCHIFLVTMTKHFSLQVLTSSLPTTHLSSSPGWQNRNSGPKLAYISHYMLNRTDKRGYKLNWQFLAHHLPSEVILLCSVSYFQPILFCFVSFFPFVIECCCTVEVVLKEPRRDCVRLTGNVLLVKPWNTSMFNSFEHWGSLISQIL